MTEAETGLPQTTEAALALSKERLGIKPDPATPPPAAEVVEQPGNAQVTAETTAQTNPAPAVESKATEVKPDWSFVADPQLRSALEGANLPPEAHSKFKDWQADYTRKSQAAKAYEAKAAAWTELESDPDLFGALKDAYAAKVTGKKPAAEVKKAFDYANSTSEEIEAHIEAQIEAKAEARARALIEAEVKAPVTRERQIKATVEGLYSEVKSNLTQEQYIAAWDKARAHYGDEAFTPENAKALFQPILEAEVAKAELARIKTQKAQDAGLALKAATPAGTAGSVKDKPPAAPERKPDGKAETARQRTLETLEQRYGYTRAQLEQAARTFLG